MTLQEKQAIMRNTFEQWQESGLTQTAFARKHSIPKATLSYWINKFRQEVGQDFIQLNGLSAYGISISYPNGVEVGLPVQTPASFIKLLINYQS
jgi:hypothetical protein